MNQQGQTYTLDQINELFHSGLLNVPMDAPLSGIPLTRDDRLNKIFQSQISEWKGKGMKVKICSKLKSQEDLRLM